MTKINREDDSLNAFRGLLIGLALSAPFWAILLVYYFGR